MRAHRNPPAGLLRCLLLGMFISTMCGAMGCSTTRASSTTADSADAAREDVPNHGVHKAAVAKKAKLFMWRVTSPEPKEGEIYVMGTMHLRRPDLALLDDKVLQVRDEAHTVVVEIDPLTIDQTQMGKMVQELGLYAGEDALNARLTNEEWVQAKRVAEHVRLPLSSLRKMKPWLAATTLEVLMLQSLGYSSGSGTEEQLLRGRSARPHQTVLSLESAVGQLRTLSGTPEAAQLAYLRQLLADFDKGQHSAAQLETLLMDGDTRGMEKLLIESRATASPDIEAFHRALLDERNLQMVKQLPPLFDRPGHALVAVGAAHLVGDEGIVSLLRRRGYTVEQVAPLGNHRAAAAAAQARAANAADLLADVKAGQAVTAARTHEVSLSTATVAFPRKPTRDEHEQHTPAGDMHLVMHEAKAGGAEFASLELPLPDAIASEQYELMLGAQMRTVRATLQDAGAVGIAERRLDQDGRAGFELRGEFPSLNGEALVRYFIDGSRMVGIMVWPKQKVDQATAAARTELVSAFADSFQFTSKTTGSLDWRGLCQAAKGKTLVVEFGADWCHDCQLLQAAKRRPDVQAALRGLHLVKVNVGRFDQHTDVLDTLTIQRIPTLVAFASKDCASSWSSWPVLRQGAFEGVQDDSDALGALLRFLRALPRHGNTTASFDTPLRDRNLDGRVMAGDLHVAQHAQ